MLFEKMRKIFKTIFSGVKKFSKTEGVILGTRTGTVFFREKYFALKKLSYQKQQKWKPKLRFHDLGEGLCATNIRV